MLQKLKRREAAYRHIKQTEAEHPDLHNMETIVGMVDVMSSEEESPAGTLRVRPLSWASEELDRVKRKLDIVDLEITKEQSMARRKIATRGGPITPSRRKCPSACPTWMY